MKAIRFHSTGGPEVLSLEDVQTPTPAAGEVRVRVAATAFNAADAGIRAGTLPIPAVLPHIPGYDVSGTVDAVGEGVDAYAVGDAVIGFLSMTADGGAAEYVVTPVESLVAAPTSIPLEDAAALPSVALTAMQALFDEAGLASGQRVLIVGAGGAVGGHAIRLARHAGAHVIATASPRSRGSVEAAGADEVVDHTSTAVTSALTEPVDVLLNLAPIDPAEFTELVALVKDGGVVVSSTAWMPTPSDDARSVRAATVYVRADMQQLAHLVGLVDDGTLRVEVERRVSLDELPGIHREAAAGGLRGKVIVIPGQN